MSDKELIPNDHVNADQELPRRSSIVVFGSRVISEDMFTVLRDEVAASGGDPDTVHQFFVRERNVDYIAPAFFGVSGEQMAAGWAQSAHSNSANNSAGHELSAMNTELETPKTLPLGVLAFKQMRRYWLAGETVDTPFDEIEALCAEHSVSLVFVEDMDPEQFRKQVGGMIALPPIALLPAPEA